MKTMYMKVYHGDGRMTTSKSEKVYSWEETPDEIVAVHGVQELKDLIERYPLYSVSHRAKSQDARDVKAGYIFSSFAS